MAMRSRSLGRWLRQRWLEIILLVALAIAGWWVVAVGYSLVPKPAPTPTPVAVPETFDGVSAMDFVSEQLAFGPRPSGSDANVQTGDYIIQRLREFGWDVQEQPFTYEGTACRNIIAKAGNGPVAIIGAHYDTRRRADQDPDPNRRTEPVLGANDGASGVAVLLELARTLDKEQLTNEVWLTFFDAEDNGGLDGWQFIAGSQYMADHLTVTPEMVVVVDMIGDADQQIYREHNSTYELQQRIWSIAAGLGYSQFFIPQIKWTMTDDHTPFLKRGFAAADLIDFDYPFWHTTADTADKLSADSLERVGRVLETLLENRMSPPEDLQQTNSPGA
jgi:glutaminyl-peptide cyclotransferase